MTNKKIFERNRKKNSIIVKSGTEFDSIKLNI